MGAISAAIMSDAAIMLERNIASAGSNAGLG